MTDSVPTGWVKITLGELVHPRRETVQARAHGGRYLGLEHVEPQSTRIAGTADSSSIKGTGVRFMAGDTLYARLRPYLNKTCAPDFDGVSSGEFIVLPAVEWLTPRFLMYFLHQSDVVAFANARSTGTHRPRVKWEDLATLPMGLPPLAEQKRIVAAIEEQFSRIDAGVEVLQRARWNLQRMRAAILQAAVTGRLVLQDLDAEPAERVLTRALESHDRKSTRGRSEPLAPDLWPHPIPNSWCLASLDMLTTGGKYGSSTKCSHDGRGLPVLRIPNIRDGRVVRDDLKFAIDTSLNLSTSRVSSGDLLFVRTNGSRDLIGRAAMVGGDFEGMAFASYLIRMRPLAELVTPRYLVYAASAPSLRAEIQARAATSAGQYNLSLATLRRLPIPLPPLTEQRRIVQEIDRQYSIFDALDRAMVTAFDHERHLRRSILAEAFDGSLVPQDSSDEPAPLLLNRIKVARDAEDLKFHNSRKGSRR